MAISKEFIPHTELKASDLNELVTQVNGYIAEINAALQAAIASSTSGIERQTTQSEEDALVFTTDGGTEVGKIDSNGADFTELKRGGQQVARMSDLPTKDSSIGDTPSTTNVPTTKAVKDYVDANRGDDYPIETETTQSEEEAVVFETDGGVQVGKIDANGADFTNLKRGGNQVATTNQLVTKDTSIGNNPSNSHVPTTKAVKKYVDEHSGGDYPIETEITQSADEEMQFTNDAGSQTYAKVGSYGMKSKAYLDMQGNNVIPTKDTSIGETPSQTNVPTSKAVVDYVEAHGGGGGTGGFPISKASTQSDTEEQVWGNDAETQEYVKVGDYGIKAKDFLDLNGNPISNNSYWKGKNIVYFGTSVPAQGYPQIIGEILQANVYNQAVGSSMMRCGRPNSDYINNNALGDDLGLDGCYFDNVMRSMSRTQKELKYIFDNWTSDRRRANLIAQGYTSEQVANVQGYSAYIGGSFPEQGTDPSVSSNWPSSKPVDVYAGDGETYRAFRKLAYSYCWDTSVNIENDLPYTGKITERIEGRMQKFLDGTIDTDLFVFDHFRNDGNDNSLATYLTEPVNKNDRNYAIGAFNYLVGKILLYKPNARIVIVGHFDNDDTKAQLGHVWEAQEKAANIWGFPLCKLWELLGIRAYVFVATTGYWDSQGQWHETGYNGNNHVWKSNNGLSAATYENPRQLADGTWVHDLTTRMIWCKDDVHPSGAKTLAHFAKNISEFINKIR